MHRHLVGLIAAVALIAIALAILPPITQDPAYHHFADTEQVFGIPNFWNVVSNLPFVWVGMVALRKKRTMLAVAAILTALGSSWYHLDPTDASLFWDRLPMALVFATIVSLIVDDRLSVNIGHPLLAISLGSVVYWRFTGDLRPYAILQFGSMIVVALLAAFFPARRIPSISILGMLALYVIAKLLEHCDLLIASSFTTGGHPWKHLAAAAALWVFMSDGSRYSRPMSLTRGTVSVLFAICGVISSFIVGDLNGYHSMFAGIPFAVLAWGLLWRNGRGLIAIPILAGTWVVAFGCAFRLFMLVGVSFILAGAVGGIGVGLAHAVARGRWAWRDTAWFSGVSAGTALAFVPWFFAMIADSNHLTSATSVVLLAAAFAIWQGVVGSGLNDESIFDAASAIRITTPRQDTTVGRGQSFRVEVKADEEFREITLLTTDALRVAGPLSKPPYLFDVMVSDEARGTHSLAARGTRTDGSTAESNALMVRIG